MSASRLGKFFQVPDSWEAWAIRVLTAAIALVFVAVYLLIGQVGDIHDYLGEGRAQRNAYQHEELARQCALLRTAEVDPAALRVLKC